MNNGLTSNQALGQLRTLASEPPSVDRIDAALAILMACTQRHEVVWDYAQAHKLMLTETMISMGSEEIFGMDCAIPGHGVGAVHIGTTEEVLRFILGAPEELVEFTGSHYWCYYTKGLSFSFEGHCVDAIFCYNDLKGGYEDGRYQRYHGQMPDHIQLTSTRQDIRQLHGPPDKSGALEFAPIPSDWISYNKGVSFDFITETHQMIYFTISKASS